MKEIVIGHDHQFGFGRAGDEQTLLALAEEHNFSVDVVPAQFVSEAIVSSSLIRSLIEDEGDMERANALLGYPYSLTASVVHGAGRGRQLGFPTANLSLIHERKVVPADGVYAVSVVTPGSPHSFVGMMNIGNRPTFEGTGRHLEVHIVDFNGDLYDQTVEISFLSHIRSEKKFEGIDELIQQLNEDKARCIASFAEKH